MLQVPDHILASPVPSAPPRCGQRQPGARAGRVLCGGVCAVRIYSHIPHPTIVLASYTTFFVLVLHRGELP
jgi:hypothetical protein